MFSTAYRELLFLHSVSMTYRILVQLVSQLLDKSACVCVCVWEVRKSLSKSSSVCVCVNSLLVDCINAMEQLDLCMAFENRHSHHSSFLFRCPSDILTSHDSDRRGMIRFAHAPVDKAQGTLNTRAFHEHRV